ncbi:hypothetical protein OMP38_15335 [Cohnella ginsengisoli]|uniref:DUF429 domain-containing protein n=1 Tax=Cohnella ginsengisoli TaxID=425004 RepID=A0A9X4KHJ3_9BACL|nr:hypothetical protein [Cohnella ginsengisoli]MDG0792086.1 hypothetical protein [Cohnella ginsengisoli]
MTLKERLFDVYIGVDYSGAGLPDKAISGLAVVSAVGDERATVVRNPRHPQGRWSRSALHGYLMSELAQTDRRVFVGIDHGFSYPLSELDYYGLQTWDEFLGWLSLHWDTRQSSVDACKKGGAPYRNADLLRLTEARYAVGASSVLDLDRTFGHMTKTVSYSTHAGLPWLAELRARSDRSKVQCWPYDHIFAPAGGEPEVRPIGGHIVAEVYPKICKERLAYKASPPSARYGKALSDHETDAFAVAEWAQGRDREGAFAPYFRLETLTPDELRTAALEGWVLGCL